MELQRVIARAEVEFSEDAKKIKPGLETEVEVRLRGILCLRYLQKVFAAVAEIAYENSACGMPHAHSAREFSATLRALLDAQINAHWCDKVALPLSIQDHQLSTMLDFFSIWARRTLEPVLEEWTRKAWERESDGPLLNDDWTAPKVAPVKLLRPIAENGCPKRGGRPVAIETQDFIREWTRIGSPVFLSGSVCDEIAGTVLANSEWRTIRVNPRERKKTRDRIRSAIRRAADLRTKLIPSQD